MRVLANLNDGENREMIDQSKWKALAWMDPHDGKIYTDTYHRYTLLKALCEQLGVKWPPKKVSKKRGTVKP